jgi:hypothetical protein
MKRTSFTRTAVYKAERKSIHFLISHPVEAKFKNDFQNSSIQELLTMVSKTPYTKTSVFLICFCA